MGLFGKSYDTIEKARAAERQMAHMEYDKVERIQSRAALTKSNEKLFLCALSNLDRRKRFAIPLITDPKALHMLVELTLEGQGYADLTRCLCAKNEHLRAEDLVCILCHTGAGSLPLDILGRLSSKDDLWTVAHDGITADLRVAAVRECIVRWPEDAPSMLFSLANEDYPDLPELLRSWPPEATDLSSLLDIADDPDLLGKLALSLDGDACLSCSQRLARNWPETARAFQPRLIAHAVDTNDFVLALKLADMPVGGNGPHTCDRAIADGICARGNEAIAANQAKALTNLVDRIESQELLMHIVLDSDLAGRYDRLPYAKQDTMEHRLLDGIAKRLDDEHLCELITLEHSGKQKTQRHTYEICDLAARQLRQRPGGQERIAKIVDGDPEKYFALCGKIQSKRLLADLASRHPDDVSIKGRLQTVVRDEGRARRKAAKTDEAIVRYLTLEDDDGDIFEDLSEKTALMKRLEDTEALRAVAQKAVNPCVRSEAAERLYKMGYTEDVEIKSGVCRYCGGTVDTYTAYAGTIEAHLVWECSCCGRRQNQTILGSSAHDNITGDYYVLRA